MMEAALPDVCSCILWRLLQVQGRSFPEMGLRAKANYLKTFEDSRLFKETDHLAFSRLPNGNQPEADSLLRVTTITGLSTLETTHL